MCHKSWDIEMRLKLLLQASPNVFSGLLASLPLILSKWAKPPPPFIPPHNFNWQLKITLLKFTERWNLKSWMGPKTVHVNVDSFHHRQLYFWTDDLNCPSHRWPTLGVKTIYLSNLLGQLLNGLLVSCELWRQSRINSLLSAGTTGWSATDCHSLLMAQSPYSDLASHILMNFSHILLDPTPLLK